MQKLSFILFLFILCINSNYGQKDEAIKIIKKLTDENFHGRGYVEKGDFKSVKFIEKEFKKIGLKPYGNFLQKFKFNVNTQPKELELSLNNLLLKPGVEYLIDPGSPSLKGTFSTVLIQTGDLLNTNKLITKINKSANKILLIDTYNLSQYSKKEIEQINEVVKFLKYSDQHSSKGSIIFSNKKLTWHGSTVQNSKISFTVNKSVELSKITSVSINNKSKLLKNYKSYNCIGHIKATNKTDSTIVITAHYDHLGRMGTQTYFPGANDNASGIALLLDLAKSLQKENSFKKYNIAFIAFGGEEIGLLGSKYFTKNPLFPLKKIKILLNFDLAGTGDEGIKVVNGSVHKKEFNLLKQLNKDYNLLPDVKSRGKACNSDHCYFDAMGIKCFYSYTLGGIKAYHDIYDKLETLPLTEFEDYSKLIQLFINHL